MEMLGIDIGGSGMKGAIVNSETGELVSERHRIPTPQPAHPEAMAKTIREIVDFFKYEGPVGCSFPTIVIDGMSKSAGNLSKKWKGVQIDALFSEHCNGLPFYVGNDADNAGVAEMTHGAGKGKMGKVIMVTIGTGLGSGFFYNGTLIPNTELGQVLHKNGKLIETYAGDAARKRDGIKLKEWAARFDYYLKYINTLFSPNYYILGGGISKKFDRFKDELSVDVPIAVAKFENNAGIIGAAMFAYQNLKK